MYALFCHRRFSIFEDFTEPPLPITTYPSTTPTGSSSNTVNVNVSPGAPATVVPNINAIPHGNGTSAKPTVSRKGGIIFPSVKNKPSVANSTFATDAISFKDVKVCMYVCWNVLALQRPETPDGGIDNVK